MSEFSRWYQDNFKKFDVLSPALQEATQGMCESVWNVSRAAIKAEGKVFRVKKLEWEDSPLGSNSIQGYQVELVVTPGPNPFKAVNPNLYVICNYESLEKAKAACQAHYEQEIMKHLTEVTI